MADKNKQLVLAFFDSEVGADSAVAALKQWDKATEDIKLGAIGVLVKDERGKIKTEKLGKRAGKKGAGAGVILGIIAAILSGGVTLLGGVVGGAVLGGVLGSFFHKGLGLSKDDLARIGKELDGGKAAVGVLVEAAEADATTAKLAELGGKPETHEVTDEALDQATEASEAPSAPAPDAAAAAPAVEDSTQT